MNSSAPFESQLSKEVCHVFNFTLLIYRFIWSQMILVASPHKPFSYTLKGAPKRRTILVEYEAEIGAVYSTTV